MAVQLENPVQRLLARLKGGESRSLIALAGLPGSGKSTLAARLAEEVNAQTAPHTMVALGMDGFHLTKAALRAMPDPEAAFARRGAPWTFDVNALASRLRLLRNSAGNQTVAWPGFEHEIGDPVEDAQIICQETRLVLVEGLYLLLQMDGGQNISRLFDELWYLDTPFDLSMTRLTERHMAAWGLTREAAERRIALNDRLNAEIVLETRTLSDWIIHGG